MITNYYLVTKLKGSLDFETLKPCPGLVIVYQIISHTSPVK